ncbi:hypothetical protein ACP6PL_25370 [Dapis sp. BLCC M126]|uniref:hypothetical protein n=1 Tax=Dapis sp. BLCC M126 TaxID=3400189 RepID=UPI003CEEA807
MIVLIKKFHVIIVAILVSFLASCAGKVESKTPTDTISSTISEPLAEVKTALANQPQSLPVQVAIIMDKTGSVEWSRIEQPQLQDFQLLLSLLKKNGGEIAVGTFCYDSNRPLARIRVEQQPMLVNAGFNHPVAPVEPTNQGNAFTYRKEKKEYKQKLAEYETLRQNDLQILASYQNSVQQWQSQSEGKIQEFMKNQLQPILSHPVNCGSSDIQGGINRAKLFLAENDATWREKPRKFAVFITDGLDNVGIQAAEFQSNAELLLVNGAGSKGIFENIEHKAFESVPAAFQYLVTQVNKGAL